MQRIPNPRALREQLIGKLVSLFDPAGHGFNCDQRTGDFHAESAATARERTLAFLAEHLG